MIPFFDTEYTVRRSRKSVFDFFSDFPRYLTDLPEFHGARLSTDSEPVAEGKVYWLDVTEGHYDYRTRLEIIERRPCERFVYDYQYTLRDSDQPLFSGEGPMPWDRARMILEFSDCDAGTKVRARMRVFGVAGFFARWKVSSLKTACARAQYNANANMVRVAENAISPD